jgi:rhamnose utilization protein RhaD (predicted bifunctional aldolase and dehydrogenase)
MSAPSTTTLDTLLSLSHELGREDRRLAILGEGNTSARLTSDSFLVKASGSNLSTLAAANLTECRFNPLLELLEQKKSTDGVVDDALLNSRVAASALKPSVEAMFHAWLLTLPGVNFVGHTHPIAVNSLLCSAENVATKFAQRRLFPDEVVCCGPESVLVPYCDPGLKLAQSIRTHVERYRKRSGLIPRIVLLQNHGLIALGATSKAVLAATLMAVKAAEITLGSLAAGGAHHLSQRDVARIAGRTDEHYRQKALGL